MSTGPITTVHYAPNANLVHGSYNAPADPGSGGFNLADVSCVAAADSLPSGVKALIWLGDTTGLTASFGKTVNTAAHDPRTSAYDVPRVAESR